LLTTEGRLISLAGTFEITFDIGDFCIDLVRFLVNLNIVF
jgi:hypothetical protein